MKRLNIYRRKDGRWEGRISKGKSKNGKRRYNAFFGRSKEEVAAKMRAYDSRNRPINEVFVTVSQLYEEWFQKNRHRLKESTAANYTMKAEKHILPEFGSRIVTEIDASEICHFIQIKQNNGLSNRYISDILIMMKSIFKHGFLRYHTANPMDGITMPKKQRTEIRLLTVDEQEDLEQYISENHNLTTLGIALAKSMGLRIGEICALQWEDIDLKKRTLTVKKTIQRIKSKDGSRKTKLIITAPKSETSHRIIPIPKFIVGFLNEFKGDAKDFLLSGKEKPIEPRTMQYRFAKILKNGKLPSINFHALRHIFASNCIKLGFDIKALSEILGHSGVEITLNRYVHSSFEQKIEYMERLKMVI